MDAAISSSAAELVRSTLAVVVRFIISWPQSCLLLEVIVGDPFGKIPKLVVPKRETPTLFLVVVVTVVATMMVLGTWAYSVL